MSGAGGLTTALYVAAMIAVIVGADIAFFRGRFWERLMMWSGHFRNGHPALFGISGQSAFASNYVEQAGQAAICIAPPLFPYDSHNPTTAQYSGAHLSSSNF